MCAECDRDFERAEELAAWEAANLVTDGAGGEWERHHAGCDLRVVGPGVARCSCPEPVRQLEP